MKIQTAFHKLHASGESWRKIGSRFGKTGGWAWLVAHEQIALDRERMKAMKRELPRELWQTTKELRSAILVHIRTQRVGIRNAVKSRYLARQYCTTDRKVRAAIHELRNEGHPICSSVGKSSGFYWPASIREYKEFRFGDYGSRIKKMQKTLDMMDMAAEAMFEGKPLEMELQAELM